MKTPQCRMRPPVITSIMGLGLLGACLAITAPCARGFSFAGGPRNIDLPMATFNKLGTVWATIGPGTDGHPEDQMVRWGTFDGPSHSLIAYPDAPGTVRLWLVFGSPTNQSSHIFEWPISGEASALCVLQASTDLSNPLDSAAGHSGFRASPRVLALR